MVPKGDQQRIKGQKEAKKGTPAPAGSTGGDRAKQNKMTLREIGHLGLELLLEQP
jgi:hypothetical protein